MMTQQLRYQTMKLYFAYSMIDLNLFCTV